jgi:hypothetical protein
MSFVPHVTVEQILHFCVKNKNAEKITNDSCTGTGHKVAGIAEHGESIGSGKAKKGDSLLGCQINGRQGCGGSAHHHGQAGLADFGHQRPGDP